MRPEAVIPHVVDTRCPLPALEHMFVYQTKKGAGPLSSGDGYAFARHGRHQAGFRAAHIFTPLDPLVCLPFSAYAARCARSIETTVASPPSRSESDTRSSSR